MFISHQNQMAVTGAAPAVFCAVVDLPGPWEQWGVLGGVFEEK